jgi:hypothetical protein
MPSKRDRLAPHYLAYGCLMSRAPEKVMRLAAWVPKDDGVG